MEDTAELLKQRIRNRRKQLQTSGSVNSAFIDENPTNEPSSQTAQSYDQDENSETKAMLEDLERRRNRRKERMLSRDSIQSSVADIENSAISELSSNLEHIKQSLKLKASPVHNATIEESSHVDVHQSIQPVGDDGSKPVMPQNDDVEQMQNVSADGDPTSESKMSTYREKIRSRINKAKSQAETKVLKDDSATDRILRMKQTSNLRQAQKEQLEEEEINRKLVERKKAKEMLNSSLHGQPHLPSVDSTVDNSFDFFTKEYNDNDQPTTSETSGGDVTDADPQQSNEESKLLLREYLTGCDQQELLVTCSVPRTSYKQNNIFFMPSIAPVSISKKINEDVENPRILEEEGLYVGIRPDINRKNLNKIENRLLRETDNISWFGEDGLVKAASSPLQQLAVTPHDPMQLTSNHHLLTAYKKATCDDHSQISSQADNRQYQLDIDISQCTFNHHPLFSCEHVLTRHLFNLCKQYTIIQQQDKIGYLYHKIAALRTACSNVNIEQVEDGDTSGKLKRLLDYHMQIKAKTMERDRMEAFFRNLCRSIIKVWKAIKIQRNNQNYVSSSYSLDIQKKAMDQDADQQAFDLEIENEVKDLEASFKLEYNDKYAQYEAHMKRYKTWRQRKKEAKRKQKAAKGSGEEEQDKVEKPVLPEQFDVEQAHAQVKQKALRIRRSPGEPILFFELKTTATVTPTNQCPRHEEQRRSEISRHKIFFKIIVNQKIVHQTNPRVLNSEFNVAIGQIFDVKVMNWVREIKVQIFEISSLIKGPVLVSEVYLPVPDLNVMSDNVQLEDFQFSNDQCVRFAHGAVGSGVQMENECFDAAKTLLTNGFIKCSVSWAANEQHSAQPQQISPANIYNGSSVNELFKLVDWVDKSNLDPNDPANGPLLHMIKTIGFKDGTESAPDYFRLDHLQEEFNFATDKEIEDNMRFQMIRMRNLGTVPEFNNYHMIPLKEKEIPRELFETYERRKRRGQQLAHVDDHRHRVSNFLTQVKEEVMERFRQVQHQKTLQDIITEDQVPDIGTLGFNLLSLKNKKRPLRPVRKDRKKVTSQNIGGTDVKLVVNIGHAVNLPVRSVTKEGRTKASQSAYHELRPYVEVVFQRQSVKTSIADGPNPTWNQELQLNFKAPHENYSATNLETIRDVVYLNIFDEVIIDLLEDDRNRDTDIHQRMEKHFLGSLHIPFSTIYFNCKVEGTFQLKMPHVLLGYDKEHSHKYSSMFERIHGVANTNTGYLSIYLTIEPSLPTPEVFREKFDSNESEKLLNYCDKWQSNVLSVFAKRNVKTTVIDVSGKTVFITRYFKAIKPPNELLLSANSSQSLPTAERIARFVSLIPSVSDNVMFPGLCDLWSTSQQFMQMLSGDEEEHAVLLCNYFLYLEKQVWFVLGSAVPEGPTAYVLTREADDLWLWNASTGTHTSVADSYNSLQSLACLINQHNIWANIQTNDNPSQMAFDLNRAADWKPFFNRSNPHPGLSSVQSDNLPYHSTDRQYVSSIQEQIESTLRENFSRWRCKSQARTRWNRHCKQVLAQVLPQLEEFTWNKTVVSDKITQEMAQILTTYNMSGFPIEMPYTDMDSIVDAVFSTGLHLNKNEDVEFALAAYVHAYPCNVLAVWVYIASLVHL